MDTNKILILWFVNQHGASPAGSRPLWITGPQGEVVGHGDTTRAWQTFLRRIHRWHLHWRYQLWVAQKVFIYIYIYITGMTTRLKFRGVGWGFKNVDGLFNFHLRTVFYVIVVQCTHLITKGGTPNSLPSGANNMLLHQQCTYFLHSKTQINCFFMHNTLA